VDAADRRNVHAVAHTQASTPGVGLGWRQPHYATLLEELPDLDFLEVHSENFLQRAALNWRCLNMGAANTPSACTGWDCLWAQPLVWMFGILTSWPAW